MRPPVKVNIIIPVPKAIKGTSTGGMTDTRESGVSPQTRNQHLGPPKAVLRYSLFDMEATTKADRENRIDEKANELFDGIVPISDEKQ